MEDTSQWQDKQEDKSDEAEDDDERAARLFRAASKMPCDGLIIRQIRPISILFRMEPVSTDLAKLV
jgi:hypothetical protein